MRRAALLAIGLMSIGVWPQDSARAQSSASPPVSLTPPKTAAPHAGTKHSAPTPDRPSTPATGGLPQLPRPAAASDYDGFNVGTDDSNAPSQVTPPARSRAANGLDAQTLVDQEDEALKRKLTICKNCK